MEFMIIKEIMIGNEEEAFIEDGFTDKINIIFSDDNHRGKTILVQSIFYCLGFSKPAFPHGFDYRKYYYVIKIEEDSQIIEICRHKDVFIVKKNEILSIFESISEFKRFWTKNIFEIPVIRKNEKNIIADPDLFLQLAFIGQDDKDTSNISNHSYYKKDDFYNLLYSFMHINSVDFEEDFNIEDVKEKLQNKKNEKKRLLQQHKIITKNDSVINIVSSENDKQKMLKKLENINKLKNTIIDYKKDRNKLNIKIIKYETLEKELNSLNRELAVGHLECLDCHSSHIGYSSDKEFSFDVSTKAVRNQILQSIKDKIDSIREDLDKLNGEIEAEQNKLKELLIVDDVSLELLLTVKDDIQEITEVDSKVNQLNNEIQSLEDKISLRINKSKDDKSKAKELIESIIREMKYAYEKIDYNGIQNFNDIFTPATQIYSGSNGMIFYLIKLYALKKVLNHKLPIIIDSFRAEDLSTNKEKEALDLYNSLPTQSIFTTTLKNEEIGKYDEYNFLNKLDYSKNTENKMLSKEYLEKFMNKLSDFKIVINSKTIVGE